MTFTDRTLTCVDCSQEFIHSADDQKYYSEKGFSSEPEALRVLPSEPPRSARWGRFRCP